MQTLRARLVRSHLAVVTLAFVLLTVAAAAPVRRAQLHAEDARLRGVSGAVAIQVQEAVAEPAARQALIEREARQTDATLLLVNSDGVVVGDSRPGAPALGARLPGIARRIADLKATSLLDDLPATTSASVGRVERRRAALAVVTGPGGAQTAAPAVLALSPRTRVPVLAGVLRPLVLAGLLALALAAVASVWLARTLARPLANLATAAGEIDAGTLTSRLPVVGDDEVATLAAAFNAMLGRLEATHAAQRDLLANIAHELRTPLTSIQGYAGALRDGAASSPADQELALAVIADETRRMSELVNQILQLARLEAGQNDAAHEAVSVASLVDGVRRAAQPQADAAQVTLHVDIADDLIAVGDTELLTQALGNLIDNAVRHTPSGGTVTLTAASYSANDGSPRVRLAVTDTGPGIPRGQLERLFERFTRGATNTAPERTARVGFGLGLAIARQIVRAHGGSLTVASVVGIGTTFAVHLSAAPPTRAAP